MDDLRLLAHHRRHDAVQAHRGELERCNREGGEEQRVQPRLYQLLIEISFERRSGRERDIRIDLADGAANRGYEIGRVPVDADYERLRAEAKSAAGERVMADVIATRALACEPRETVIPRGAEKCSHTC